MSSITYNNIIKIAAKEFVSLRLQNRFLPHGLLTSLPVTDKDGQMKRLMILP